MQMGGEWKILYFKAPKEDLKERLRTRNAEGQTNNHYISENLLEKFIGEFEAPDEEREEVIEQ